MHLSNEEGLSFDMELFKGPLDLLIQLIAGGEIELGSLLLQKIPNQYRDFEKVPLDEGAEFMHHTSTLMLLKSQSLLPSEEKPSLEEEKDPRFELLAHLLNYTHFKNIAVSLKERFESNQELFPMGGKFLDPLEETPLEASLNALASLFTKVLEKAPLSKKDPIPEEEWKVSDKIIELLEAVPLEGVPFTALFTTIKPKLELIVLFLALLELLKQDKLLLTSNLMVVKAHVQKNP